MVVKRCFRITLSNPNAFLHKYLSMREQKEFCYAEGMILYVSYTGGRILQKKCDKKKKGRKEPSICVRGKVRSYGVSE